MKPEKNREELLPDNSLSFFILHHCISKQLVSTLHSQSHCFQTCIRHRKWVFDVLSLVKGGLSLLVLFDTHL